MSPEIPAGANCIYKAPEGWDEATNGPCLDVHALREDFTITTLWKPSPEELEQLNKGGCVMLVVAGKHLPPVIVATCAQ